VLLLEGLRLLDDEKKRRAFALGLLASFRALRSLRYVPSPPAAHTRRVLVILALVRSELHALVGYLESDLPRLYPGAGAPVAAGKAAAQKIREVLASVRRCWRSRSPIAPSSIPAGQAGGGDQGVRRHSGQCLDPAMGHYALFEDDAARTDQSERLPRTSGSSARCAATPPMRCSSRMPHRTRRSRCGATRPSSGRRVPAAAPLRRELFDRFLDLLEGWSGRPGESTQIRLQRLRDDCQRFCGDPRPRDGARFQALGIA